MGFDLLAYETAAISNWEASENFREIVASIRALKSTEPDPNEELIGTYICDRSE